MGFAELADMLAEISGVDADSIRMSTCLSTELGLCSYDIMTLIAMIEAKTGIKINLLELSGQMTVGDLIDVIK